MAIGSLTVDEFLARLGSSDPAPGGGALAALAGAMAAAMLAMVCNLTVGRPRYADVESAVQAILTGALERQERLMQLADADVEAYASVMDAYRLPRGDDAERSARETAIERARQSATRAPLNTASTAREVLDLAERAAALTNLNALGDVAVAAHLALAAARGAGDQARLNVAALRDVDFAQAATRRIESLLEGADVVVARTIECIQARTARP